MGEYARFRGQRIKIGTCEDMYYLRADQISSVFPESDSMDPRNPGAQKIIRFRFPWPDEDGTEPGAFDRYDRSVGLWDLTAPATLKHHSVQFVAQAGYNVCLPCPESVEAAALESAGVKIHRNGFRGPVCIVQQAYRNGNLAVICQCGGCEARYNLPTSAEAEPVIVACRAEADRAERRGEGSEHARDWWHKVADRIAAGYRS